MPCLFCRMVTKEIPATVVYEDDRALAFRDIRPVAPTHVLVIPKKHVETINDVTAADEADVGHLYVVAAQVAKAEGLTERGYRTVMNCNAEAGQTVFHLHLHVVGGHPMGWPPFPA